MSQSPRMIESISRRPRTKRTLSKEVLAAVVKDDDDRAARSEQIGQDLTTRLRRRTVASGDRGTRRRTCLLQDSSGTGEQRRLHQTRRPVNQSVRVCVETCPLTTRHTAKRSGDSCQARALGRDLSRRHSFGGMATWK